MAHFTMTRTDSWPAGSSAPAPNWIGLDSKVFKLVNGDDGGCWGPSGQISLFTTSGGGLLLTGPLVILGVSFSTSSGALIKLDNGDYPTLAAGHKDTSRVYVNSCVSGAAGYPKFGVRPHLPYVALQAVAATFQLADGTIVPNTWRVPLRVCNGSTLSSVTVTYRPLMGNPSIRIERVDANGVAVPLTSVAAGANANGFIIGTRPAVATVDPTTGLPTVNSITIPIDGGASSSQAVIDISQYSYFLRVIEDQTLSPVYPNLLSVRAPVKYATTGSNLSLSGLAAVDGIALIANDRVLVKDQTNSAQNGIYRAASGAWGYAPDADVAGDPSHGGKYPQGMIVPVQFGTVNGGSYWQLQQTVQTLNVTPQTYGPIPANPLSQVQGASFGANGNFYLDAVLTHTNITDDRPQ